MILALVRPGSWNLPLFLHVLGGTLTFGATATVAILAFAGRPASSERALWLRGLAFRIGILVLIPAWVLLRVAAGWIDSKEFPHHEPGWVGVGYPVTEGGALLIVVMLVLAWLSRRKLKSRAAAVVPWLASVYLVALGIAWFAMSAKPGGSG
jgi:hypothetical protein